MRNYLLHGSRHGPNGSDPIPDFPAGTSWIAGWDNLIVVPSQSTPRTHYDFTPSNWYTNDSSVFDVVTSTGVTINGDGFYIAMLQCEWNDGAGDVTKCAEMLWNISGEGNELHDAAAFLPDFMAGLAITKSIQGWPQIGSSGADLTLRQTSGASADVGMQFMVARLSADAGNF